MTNRMTSRFRYVILFLLFISILIPAATVNASDIRTNTTTFIEDEAEVFTEQERIKLTEQCKKIQDKYKVDVVIITRQDTGSKIIKRYMEDYYDRRYDIEKNISKDTVLVLRTIKNRWVEIQGYGKCEGFINNNRIESILDDMESTHRQNRFYDAFSIMLDDVYDYLGTNPNPLTWTWVQFLIAIVIGGISVACMVASSGGKVTTNNRTYLDNAHSGLVAKRDIYLNTTVKRIHRPQSNGGGGGGGHSGRSSGGHSHSGGGRSM